MRKKSLVIILLILIGFITYNLIKLNTIYSQNISSNWNIKLPSSYSQVYPLTNDSTLEKPCKRYHIFKYDDINQLNNLLNWKIKDDSSLEDTLTTILNSMDIPKEFMPQFQCDYKYFIQKKDDSSIIYILLVNKYNMLYIIEDIKS